MHLAISDSTGDSAVIEYTDDDATVWHNRDYKVMTNSPTYDQQLELLTKIEGFADLDLSEGASVGRLDLLGDTALQGGLAGNVGKRFEERAPLQFLSLG